MIFETQFPKSGGHRQRSRYIRIAVALVPTVALSACDVAGIDYDMRDDLFGSFSTSTGTVTAQPRPEPDARGVISYDDYQVVVAQSGDTALSIGSRLGISGTELARFNGLDADTTLRQGELLALPTRVAADPATPVGGTDNIVTIAGDAIERSELPDGTGTSQTAATGAQPLQHRVQPGETAYSIARLYGVSVRALADWNALGPDLAVRDDQVLMIPVGSPAGDEDTRTAALETTQPGEGSVTPVPPSASQPLPEPEPAAVAPESPDLDQYQTAASDTSSFAMPVTGSIIRNYDKSQNIEGIGIAADAGTPVRAANGGEVAAITRDVDQVPILVLRHPDNLLSVYANVADIAVEKGDKVSRGQQIAAIAPGDPAFLHFEIREGIESVDPLDYLQ